MKKVMFFVLILSVLVSIAFAGLKEEVESSIKKNLIQQGAKAPKVDVKILEQLKGTNIFFLEVKATGENIQKPIKAFLLSDGRYLYQNVIELSTGLNMIEVLKSKYNIVKFSKKDLEDFTLIEGNKGAKNTIVMITDFECPFCKKAHFLLKELLKDKKDYAFYIFNFPLKKIHKKSELFAKILIAGARLGYDFRDELYNFKDKSLSDEKILEIFSQKTKEPKKFKEIALSRETSNQIEKNISKGEELGVRGTPVIIVNGKRVDGFNPVLVRKYINEI
ncbi:thioredoxin domain-containing protein [Deferribacter thermophilus]|uniref:DsbA family protein n=1 Tax=Deferribacter thermophilus TaxID=53573 RepID=UPI003C1574C9